MNKKKCLIIIILLLVTILILDYSISFAKYAKTTVWNYYLKSKDFYFESNLLSVNNKKNIDKNWNGESLKFTLRNNLNNSLITDYDISYTAVCKIKNSNGRCIFKESNSNTFKGVLSSSEKCINNKNLEDVSNYNQTECETNNFEWKTLSTYKDLSFDIIDDNREEIEVLVTVTAEKPYKKTLTGEFILKRDLNSNDAIKTSLKKHLDYSEVILTNNQEENKCLNLRWNNNNIKVDYDSDKIKNYTTDSNNIIDSIIVEVSKNNNQNIRFFSSDNINIDINNFTIMELDNC